MGRMPAQRAARTLYNTADALHPALSLDVVAELADVDRRLAWLLDALEWRSRLRFGRGFSWQPRERRRALLASWPGRAVARRVQERIARAQSRADGA